jgi:hypothetical protein
MSKISKEIATKDVERWLEFKKVSEKRREKKAESIETLIDLVMNGVLVIEEDLKITQVLCHPLKNEQPVEKLVYAPRIDVAKIHAAMKGVSAEDFHGMIVAYGQALTALPKKVLTAIDSEDYVGLNAVAIFFM